MSQTPAKVTRIELVNDQDTELMNDQDTEITEVTEGEEWLSEGILTDEDYVGDQNNSASNMSQDESTMNSAILEQDHILNESELAEMDMLQSQDDNIESTEYIRSPAEIYHMEVAKVLGRQDNMINTLKEIHNDNSFRTGARYGEQGVTATSTIDQPSTSNQQVDAILQKVTTADQQDTKTNQQVTTSDQQVTTTDQQVTTTDQQLVSNIQIRRSTDEEDFDDLTDDLSTFLIRKSDGAIIETNKDISDNDGNDTDELLRMLGDDGKGAKLKFKTTNGDKKPPVDDSTDEDIFETAKKESNMKLAQDMVTRKNAMKHRKRSETDQSTDEDRSSRKKYKSTKKSNVSSKSTTKLINPEPNDHGRVKVAYHVPKGRSVNSKGNSSSSQPKPIKTDSNIGILKTLLKGEATNNTPKKPEVRANVPKRPEVTSNIPKKPEVKANVPKKQQFVEKPREVNRRNAEKVLDKSEDMVEEFLDEDELGLDSVMKNEKDTSKMGTDSDDDFDESCSDFDDESQKSNYTECDELMSSDESDLDDWFTLDLRAERAGEYIPLLGSKAFEMLNKEKERVKEKLRILRENIETLSKNGKKQTVRINECRSTLSEIDVQLALV